MREKLALQIAIAIAGLVPVTAGALGFEPELLGFAGGAGLLSHAAYLNGLLLGVGAGFWSLIPHIERQRAAFSLLTAIVAVGGMARLVTAIRLGAWTADVLLPLGMELVVTPGLWLWQRRIAKAG